MPRVCGCARAPARIGVVDVKLLLDENLSPRLLTRIRRFYPGSRHVEQVGLKGRSDRAIWEYAHQNNFIITSKDNDFRQRSFLYGPPPKVIWLAVGNAGTGAIAKLLTEEVQTVRKFFAQPEEGLLILEETDSPA